MSENYNMPRSLWQFYGKIYLKEYWRMTGKLETLLRQHLQFYII